MEGHLAELSLFPIYHVVRIFLSVESRLLSAVPLCVSGASVGGSGGLDGSVA